MAKTNRVEISRETVECMIAAAEHEHEREEEAIKNVIKNKDYLSAREDGQRSKLPEIESSWGAASCPVFLK